MTNQRTDAPVNSESASQRAQAALSGCGALCWWDLSNTSITPVEMQAILDKENIGIDVPKIEPKSAIKRAARTWSQGRGNGLKFRADLVKTDDAGKMKVCILQRGVDGQGSGTRAKWNTVETAVYDLSAKTWDVSSDDKTQTDFIAKSFVSLADQYLTHLDHNWIRPNLIQKRLEEIKGFSLKASSGLWYTTQDRLSDLAALQRVVSSIGNSTLHVIHVNGTDSSRSAIESGARGSLQGGLSELEEKLADWTKSSRKIRTDAIETTLNGFQNLIDRADLYSDALKVRMDDLQGQIKAARNRAKEIINGNLGAHSDPTTKPIGKRAQMILSAIQAGFKPNETFTVTTLEELLGASSGTLQTHLRDLARIGKVDKSGRDSQGAHQWFLVGPQPTGDEEPVVETAPEPVVEESVTVETQVETQVEEEAVVEVAIETQPKEDLDSMNRTALRARARKLRADEGISIPRASKMGASDLRSALAAHMFR